jgi:hypothetical protein
MRLTNFGDWDEINAFYNALRAVEVDDAITTPAALVVVCGAWLETTNRQVVAEGASKAASVPHDRSLSADGSVEDVEKFGAITV